MSNALIHLPALIIRAPFALAAVSGVPVERQRIVKHIECRGKRLRTNYRGAVAIFASRNYQATDEQTIAEVFERNGGKRSAARPWCRDVKERFSYRLTGFVSLFNCLTTEHGEAATDADYRELHAAAFDFGCSWHVETYLAIEPLHALISPGPEFTEACSGCLARPPHNATACHVGWQRVSLSAHLVPDKVLKAISQNSH